jgi:RimJ/RimL family protein N-acetyltransferase
LDRIRRARPEDCEAVARLCLALNAEEAVPGERFTPDAMLRDAFGPLPRMIVFVAEHAGEVVGYALATPSYESNWAASGFYVGDVYVAPPARRRGLGRKLIAALTAQAKRDGREYLWWTSLPHNAAGREFYCALGATTEEVHAHALVHEAFARLAEEGMSGADWKEKSDVRVSAALNVERANASAIPFIMATERIAGYDDLVGRWEEAQHRAALADGRHAYFVASDRGAPIGFAILRDWASPECATLVKRIAVARPSLGHGRALLAQVVRAAFEQTDVWRVWLGVFPENTRARRAYAAVGFKEEGIARGNASFGGVHRDEMIMSVLRPEWEAERI